MLSMKRLTAMAAASITLIVGASCVRKPATTPPGEPSPGLDREAASDLGFTRDVLEKIEAAAGAPLEPVTDWEGVMTGVQAPVPEGQIDDIRESLDADLEPLGFLVFQSEMGFAMGPDKVGAVRGSDHYDILRAVQTDGANYDIMNDDIIAKLKEWEKQCEFEITGAGGDWLQAKFVEMPPNMDAFAAEVYEFCPDVVDQGAGDVHALAVEMALENSLYLWWD
ncbi:MAG TPA: DUF4253 domain-containing protein [Armatimonadota bacterium]|nr:DUF4253 domain-containing protein [Armatimonadota bacterium]